MDIPIILQGEPPYPIVMFTPVLCYLGVSNINRAPASFLFLYAADGQACYEITLQERIQDDDRH